VIKLLCVFLTCMAFSSAEAAICVEMNSKQLLSCTLSSRHHNRIAVEGQRIKKIIYPEGEILIRIEEQSGQIFVQAMVDHPGETTVSIVTSEGLVQDLELSFQDKASEILLLQEKHLDDVTEAFGDCDDETSAMQRAIEVLLSGKVPEEYVPIAERQFCCCLKRQVTLRSIMRLIGPIYTIYVFLLENSGHKCERIHESEINCVDGEWIFLEKNELKRGEKMMALIGVKTYEP